MRLNGLRLHYKILIPFVLIALAATATTAYVALAVTARALQSRVDAQIVNAATLVGQNDFALNPAILRSVKAIAGADVVTYTTAGRILASTLEPGPGAAMVAAMAAAGGDDSSAPGDAVRLESIDCGEPCRVAYRRVSGRPDTIVAVITSTAELLAVTRAINRTILIAALASLLVMVLASQFVARRVTSPLEALVRFTRDVPGSGGHRRAPDGDDEIGRLGRAFNEMLDTLDRSRESLVRSEKLALTGLLAARLAHDIRNPMSAIKMQTELLLARLGPGSDRQGAAMLESIRRDLVQIESVVSDLLDLARPGDPKRESVKLLDVVDRALEHVAPHLAYHKIDVTTSIDPGLPPVRLDAPRFKRALLNVIHNAAEAMPAGGRLTLTAEPSADGSEIRLDVCDDGAGIDETILPRVFDPFVSSKRDGIGLGLVNTKSVVDSHGGRIEIGPLAAGGTRVSIWLPADHARHG